jgi:hypothetical protein
MEEDNSTTSGLLEDNETDVKEFSAFGARSGKITQRNSWKLPMQAINIYIISIITRQIRSLKTNIPT